MQQIFQTGLQFVVGCGDQIRSHGTFLSKITSLKAASVFLGESNCIRLTILQSIYRSTGCTQDTTFSSAMKLKIFSIS